MDTSFIVLMLVIALPIGWLASEFYDNREARISLGVLAIAMSYFVATVVGSLVTFQSNIYFGETSQKLIETTVAELEAGNAKTVLVNLQELQSKYRPTYEGRANYQELVNEYAESLAARPAPP